jgi:L-alanine-DL-glutamate epimerase-like enolase superfamily enzyme
MTGRHAFRQKERPSTSGVAVERVDVSAYSIPTEEPESDGTLEWEETTIVVVELAGGGETGLGYTYGPNAVATLIDEKLSQLLSGSDPASDLWGEMGRQLRNAGRPGIGSMAIAAVDTALWDLRARLHGVSLVEALGAARETVPLYGSGGFTSYSDKRLAEQLAGWADEGFPSVKMKVGREPERDSARLDEAREAIGDEVELFVDANGAYSRQEAVDWAGRYNSDSGVTWFEEPVSSADLEGLRIVRENAGLDVAAGEYIYVLADARNLLVARAVDCLQADVTRCGGITGFLEVAALAEEHGLDLSGHCAPQISVHACAAVPRLRHLEWFHDHVRVERMLFDGALEPEQGRLEPDRTRPGHGLALKRPDAERYAA